MSIEPDPGPAPRAAESGRPDDEIVIAPEAIRPRRHRLAIWSSLIGIALAAFATGIFIFNNLVMPRLVHSVGEVKVPDLTNLTVEQAEKTLRPIGLALSRAGEKFDPSAPRGFIISQDPAPETAVRGKKLVSVTVSLGEEFSSVPALFGESPRSARYLLERAGLRLGGTTRAPSEEVGDGLIVASDPPAEAVVQRDTPVSLLISTGAGEESFVMPDLMGREIGRARRQLEVLGFRVLMPPAAPSLGTVVHQDPPAGSRITRSSQIVLQATGRMIR